MSVEIIPITADDAELIDEWFALTSLIRRHDLPDMPPLCPVHARGRFRTPWPGMRDRVWLTRVDGHAIGVADASLSDVDNLDNADVDLRVHPRMRRTGLGRRLLGRVLAYCRAEGRATVIGSTVEALPGGVPRDLKIEPEAIDVARARAIEHTRLARGDRSFHTGVRHDATDAMIAWTLLVVDATIDHHGWQQITIVAPAHRGHRLGIIAKLENLAYTRAHIPLLRQIDTWTAADNTHMIAINDRIGFRPTDRWVRWQLQL